ncbi:hypothetical protein [Bradyrhizobium sp. DOA1]|uniref:hypothetical protein n=1 Tax=Bradyrhizobium sp. DOA1 TaxID=1126616 RepID=UPI000B1EEE79|nr:hypothetical protein [Bradyrhizobium sp. DOA1]
MFRNSTRIMSAALVMIASEGGAASAQGTMQQQEACRPDVFRLCSSYIPNVGAIVACLRGNEPRLSEPCHQVMFSDANEPHQRAARMRAGDDQ